MPKEYKLITIGDHIYDLEIKELTNDFTTFTLSRSSKDSGWTNKVKGESAVLISDNGNGITALLGKKKIEIAYSEVPELLAVLSEYVKHSDPRVEKYEAYKKDED